MYVIPAAVFMHGDAYQFVGDGSGGAGRGVDVKQGVIFEGLTEVWIVDGGVLMVSVVVPMLARVGLGICAVTEDRQGEYDG